MPYGDTVISKSLAVPEEAQKAVKMLLNLRSLYGRFKPIPLLQSEGIGRVEGHRSLANVEEMKSEESVNLKSPLYLRLFF